MKVGLCVWFSLNDHLYDQNWCFPPLHSVVLLMSIVDVSELGVYKTNM